MDSNRQNLYRDVHKALRAEIFEVVRSAGSLDAEDALALAAFRTRALRLARLLASHTHHEDGFVMPLVAAADAAVHRRLESAHPRLDGMIANLAQRVKAGPRATPHGAWAHDLYLRLASFAGEYLLHLADEELLANPALWASHDDEVLREAEQRLVASIPPDEMADWLELMFPAMNASERRSMLRGMREGMPPEAFAGVLEIARRVLPPVEWVRLEADLAIPAVA